MAKPVNDSAARPNCKQSFAAAFNAAFSAAFAVTPALMAIAMVMALVSTPVPVRAQQLNSLCCYDPTEFTSLNCMCLAENEGACPSHWMSAPLAENITIWDYNQQFCVAYAQYLAENQIQRPVRDLTWASLVNQSAEAHAFDTARRTPQHILVPPRADTDTNGDADADASAVTRAVAPMSAARAVAILGDFFAIVKQTCQHSQYAQCVCCAPATTSPCNPGGWDCCSSVVFAPSTGGACAFAPAGACNCQY